MFVVGLGTALKILFLAEDNDRLESTTFRRSEVISLLNTLGRLTESVEAVQRFRKYHLNFEGKVSCSDTTHWHQLQTEVAMVCLWTRQVALIPAKATQEISLATLPETLTIL